MTKKEYRLRTCLFIILFLCLGFIPAFVLSYFFLGNGLFGAGRIYGDLMQKRAFSLGVTLLSVSPALFSAAKATVMITLSAFTKNARRLLCLFSLYSGAKNGFCAAAVLSFGGAMRASVFTLVCLLSLSAAAWYSVRSSEYSRFDRPDDLRAAIKDRKSKELVLNGGICAAVMTLCCFVKYFYFEFI